MGAGRVDLTLGHPPAGTDGGCRWRCRLTQHIPWNLFLQPDFWYKHVVGLFLLTCCFLLIDRVLEKGDVLGRLTRWPVP